MCVSVNAQLCTGWWWFFVWDTYCLANQLKLNRLPWHLQGIFFLIPKKYQALLQTMVVSKYLKREFPSPSRCIILRNKGKKVTYIFSYILQAENKRHFPTFIRSSNTPLKIPKYLLSKDCGWLTAGNCKKYTVNVLII